MTTCPGAGGDCIALPRYAQLLPFWKPPENAVGENNTEFRFSRFESRTSQEVQQDESTCRLCLFQCCLRMPQFKP
jgi:hypothetical protein